MVYKKIGDKIPSLSSLLLAGALFTAGKCKSGDSDSGVKDDPSMLEDDSLNSGGKNEKAGNVGQKLSSDLAEAVKKFKTYLVQCANLDYLSSSCKPLVVSLDMGEGKDKDRVALATTVKALIQSFYDEKSSAPAYPRELKESFKALDGLVTSKLCDRHPYAVGSAMSTMPRLLTSFRQVYTDYMANLNNGIPQVGIDKLIGRINDLIIQANDQLIPDSSFVDTNEKCKLLGGARMARFLRGTSKGAPQGKYQDVLTILKERKLQDLWIKFKKNALPTSDEKDVAVGGVLSKVGTAVLTEWKVEGGEKDDHMPDISAVANHLNGKDSQGKDITMKYVFKDITGTHADCEIDKCFMEIGSDNTEEEDAAIQCATMSFDQFLRVALFGKGNVFTLDTSNAGPDYVQFTSNNTKYMQWVDAANKTIGEFASHLGSHLESANDLKKFFVIPDGDLLERSIIHGINTAAAANSGHDATMPAQSEDGTKIPGKIGADGQSYQLFKNILQVFSPSQIVANSAEDLYKKIQQLALLAENEQAKGSNLTFTQRVCIKLASVIVANPDKVYDTANGSADNLIALVKRVLKDEVALAIVSRVGDKYVPTSQTELIKQAIIAFDQQLIRKYKNYSVTYQMIQDKSTGELFDIDTVRKTFVKHFEEFRSIIKADVVPIIQVPSDQQVDYASRLGIRALTQAYYQNLDEIREGYHNKGKASTA